MAPALYISLGEDGVVLVVTSIRGSNGHKWPIETKYNILYSSPYISHLQNINFLLGLHYHY